MSEKQQPKVTCAYAGCNETEHLYDLTPFNAPEGQEFYACKKHYHAVAQELLDDGYILDKPEE